MAWAKRAPKAGKGRTEEDTVDDEKSQKEEDERKFEGSSRDIDREKAEKILKVLIIAASVSAASAQGGEDDHGFQLSIEALVAFYTVMVICLTSLFWWVVKEGVLRWWCPSRSGLTRSTQVGSPPTTPPGRRSRGVKARNEENEEEEESRSRMTPRTPEMSRPRSLPAEIPLTPPQGLIPPLPGQGSHQEVIICGQWNATVTTSPGRIPTPGGKDENQGNGLNEVKESAKGFDDRNPTSSSSQAGGSCGPMPKARTMPPAPSIGDPTPVTNQDEGPLVLTTKFGKAFHSRANCDYGGSKHWRAKKRKMVCHLCSLSGRSTHECDLVGSLMGWKPPILFKLPGSWARSAQVHSLLEVCPSWPMKEVNEK